jgi:hypothetical protein
MAAPPEGNELARQAYKVTMIFAAVYIAIVFLFVI